TRKPAATFGTKAETNRIAAATKAIARLVAPVADETPTRLGPTLIPIVPSKPPIRQPSPSARTPFLIFAMSGRLQAASLARWQVVTTPMVRSAAASPPARNAGA